MTIIVETSGPVDSIPSVISSGASTFSNLVGQIADEIDDQTGEYSAAIQNAIFQSIRYCERQVYYFNETRDVTFPTIDNREWYDGTDNPNIPTLVRIVEAYCERSDGDRTLLRRVQPQDIEIVADNSASRGEPYSWTYFDRKVRIYPIPDGTQYTIRLQLGPYRLAPITDPDQSNAWTTEAFDMIKARSKYVLDKDILKDATLTAEALSDYNDQHAALKAETSSRNGTGRIVATCF